MEIKGKDKRDIAAELFKKYAIVLVLILLIMILSLLSPQFLKIGNIKNILRQISVVTIMSFGVNFVIITAGIDLGLGSYVALASVVSAIIAKAGHPVVFALLAALGIGLLIGMINGAIISGCRIPPFIVTLGMTQITRGAALLITNGKPVSLLGDGYTFFGKGNFLGIPMPVVIMLLVFVISSIKLNNMKFGKYTKAIGGNETAAKISGINTGLYKFYAYAFAGLCCGIAAIVLTGRIDSGQPGLAIGYELDAIAAAVVGGTGLNGGIGTMWGAFVGSLIIGSLNTGLNLLNVSSYWQQVCKGMIIIIAIILDERKNRVKA
ncbi:MAG TPA: sugar ABC transporter permease [Ruminiclostridium sp.]|jgi:inositol transport system permease protein|nr:sugar ABC transporter permease [Ruminiclostridium sp.]